MCRVMSTGQCVKAVEYMDKYSRIPLLVAANLEAGGNGMIKEGTNFGKPMQVAATADIENARRLGEICGVEGSAVGGNWAFAPVVDIDYNWRNPVTNVRTFGSDVKTVTEMGVAYVKEHTAPASMPEPRPSWWDISSNRHIPGILHPRQETVICFLPPSIRH